MERFAINILHKQIYKICRLCGVDQPSKVPILEETEIEIIVGDEEEATLAKKILDCVGIEVSKDDKMPQNICSLCVDKISDFYEYRLMCAATNLQTRTILNLPLVEPSRKQLGIAAKADVKDVKEDVKIEAASSSSCKKGKKRRGPPSPSPSPSPAPTTRVKAPIDVKDEPVPSTPVKALTKKERLKQLQQQQLLAQQKLEKDKESEAELKQTRSKRKEPSPDEAEPSSSKQQTAKSELTVPVPKKIKFEHPCSFCSDEFKTQTELDSHLGLKHVPTVRKFGCGSCRETFESVLEFKDHNLWHQLTRTPYTCFKCKRKWDKNAALVKHVSLNACGRISRGRPPAILPDVQCRLCNRKFKTQNLFEWHSCFLKPKSKCPKCDKYFVKKQILTRHYMMFCTGTLPPPEPLLIPKDEPVEQPAAVNSKSGAAAVPGTAAGTAERRTRRSLPAEPELPKEEREIPFPPPLELEPEAPAPTPSSSARKRGRPKNAPPSVEAPAPAAAPADAAADKIATLLDTGSKLDKDTDIATINNLLSSVTEAIASISEAKAKKKKKKKDKTKDRVRNVDTPTAENSSSPVDTRTEEERKADEFAEQAAQMSMDEQLALCKMPMVVLAKTTFKQETTEIDTEPSQLQEPLGNGDDDDDNYEESGNDYGGFQDEDDEEAAAPPPPPAAAPAPAAEEIPFPMPIKQEEDTPAESESQPADKEAPPPQDTTFNEQLALNIKREPGLEEDSEPPAAKKRRPESRTSVASPASTLSSSSGPVRGSPKPTLILKIKKEKGLLNATVSEPISVDDDEGDEVEERSQSKARKSVYKKPNVLAVRIKQEKVDPAYERQEIIAAQSSELPGGIRIKQERIDPEELESSSSPIEAQDLGEAPARKKQRQTREPSPVIAFDGVRIKQEKPDRPVEPATKSATPSPSPDATPKPTEKKKKSKVKINPFALLKQRMAAEAAAKSASEPPQSASPLPVITNVVGNAAASTASSSTRSSISGDAEPAPEQPVPVIAQVQSIAKDAAVEDDFPMPIKEEPTEESSTAADEKKVADGGDEEEEQDEFPMPIKEEAPEEAPPAESADDAEEDEFPMPIKEEPEESQNGVVEQPSAVEEEEKSKDVPEQAEEPAAKEKDDANDEEPGSSPEKVEEPATEEIDEKEDEDAKSSPEEADEPEAKDASPEEPEEEESTPEEPEVEESSPKEIQEETKSPEEQKTEEPEDEEKSPEENQDEQESAEEQNPQECSEPSPAPAEETKEDEVESTPEDTNGEEQDQPAEPEDAPAKLDEPLEDIPEESTSPISDTPMDEYEQNSQEQPEPRPEKSDEPPKPAPESDFEELQNLLTEGLRPPDLDCSTSVTETGTQPPETGGLDVDLDSLLNNKLDEISGGAPQQPDDLQLAIERELLNEMMPPAPVAQANEGTGNGQEQSL
ncbi:titin-like [Culex pipiens pallens]|uniref:titin-like n=1 Tax=Culex pipiens pallens TaxID=42434 RepID=UPI0019549E69|nr:titin-like [Culex pipiens pallens]